MKALWFLLVFATVSLANPPATTQSDFSVKLEAAEVQPTQLPVRLRLIVDNSTANSLIYETILPGQYLQATGMHALITDDHGQFSKWQYLFPNMLNGGIDEHEIQPGHSLVLWTHVDPLPPGNYLLEVKPQDPFDFAGGWARKLEHQQIRFHVVDDPELRSKVQAQIIRAIEEGDDAAARIATQYRSHDLLEALYGNLKSDDDRVTFIASDALRRIYRDPPKGLHQAVVAGLEHRLVPPKHNAANHNIDPWVNLLNLAQQFPDGNYIPSLIKFSQPRYTYVREYALKDLGQYDTPAVRATLKSFLNDQNDWLREVAACYFAFKKDPAAIEPLVDLAHIRWRDTEPWIYAGLAQFPNDPKAKATIDAARSSSDPQVRNAANHPIVQLPP